MNKLLILLMAVMASAVFLVPFTSLDKDFVQVDVYTSETQILLSSKQGELTLPFFMSSIYNLDNPFDFFPELIDGSSIQRLQLFPYQEGIACSVKTSLSNELAGNYEFCLVLATKLDIPLYVHEKLLVLPSFSLQGSL